MLRRSTKRKPFAGDAPLFRRTFLHECGIDPAAPFSDHAELRGSYRAWLLVHGIDPETGKMTPAGLDFFRELLADEHHERHSRTG